MITKLCSLAAGFLLLAAPARSADIALTGWNEDVSYVSSNQNSQRTPVSGEIPFSLATPITPSSGYADTPFYAAIKTNGSGGLNYGAKIVNNDPNNGSKDAFVFGRTATGAAIGDQVTGAFIWKRSDFFALSSTVTGPLTVGRLLFHARLNGTANGQARYILGSGGTYMISANMGLNTSYSSTPKSSTPGALAWYSYDPANINTIGSVISSPSFTNIDSAGVFLTATTTAASALTLGFTSFDIEGNSTPKVFGYYPTSRQSTNLPIASIPWSKTSHVIHSFAKVDSSGALVGVSGYLPSSTLTSAAHTAGKKVLLALGGAANNDAPGYYFTTMARDLTKRNAFVAAVAGWVSTYGYDGVVLDWEFPDATDTQRLVNFVYALRTALGAGKEIGLNVGHGNTSYSSVGFVATQAPTDNPATTLNAIIDYLMVMSYDFHGTWNYAGYNAPLFAVSGVGDDYSFNKTYNLWTTTKGFSSSKVIMGLPFYGRGVTGYTAFGASVTGNTAYAYTDMLAKISDVTWTKSRDTTTTGETDKGLTENHQLPHMIKSGEMISYEDTTSIPPKVRWFRGKGLQGYLIWEIGQDYNGTTNLLLDSARAVW